LYNRLRLMMGATALLYLGPLMAGLGGFGWRVVPVFIAIFLLWTLILRPSSWPQTRADWQRPEAVVTLVAQSLVQALLVIVCFGIGRGLGGVLGALPPFPVLLPVAISFLAIPLCRLIWDPKKAEAMDRFLDTAIDGITAASAEVPLVRSDQRALAAQLLAPLQALPDDTSEDELERHLLAIASHAHPEDIEHVLRNAAMTGTATTSGLRAWILHATDLRSTDTLAGEAAPAAVFQFLSGRDDLTLLFARRCAAQLQDDPAAWWDSPDPETLRNAADRVGPEASAALIALADLTTALAPPDAVFERDAVHAPESDTRQGPGRSDPRIRAGQDGG